MGLAFGGPYDGFTVPSMPGESDKHKIVETHIQVFKVFLTTWVYPHGVIRLPLFLFLHLLLQTLSNKEKETKSDKENSSPILYMRRRRQNRISRSQGIPGHPGVSQGIQGIPGYLRISQGIPGYQKESPLRKK